MARPATKARRSNGVHPRRKGSWSESALKVLRERYLARRPDGSQETPEEMLWRVALTLAETESRWGRDADEIATAFYDLMVDGCFLPNSPTLMNAGRHNDLQYSACYVLPVEDTMEGIFDAIKKAALIHQSGGGTGFAFSRLRPRDALVKSTGGRASGPVSFLRVFNAATEAVKQGGTRRGANMGVLRVDHPDIEEFIRCKLDGGITNFNISVAASDAFMEAVLAGGRYPLVDHEGKTVREVEARAVFDQIVDAAWHTGDPGLLFIDRINRSRANPTPDVAMIEATNPCVPGETWIHTARGPRLVYDLVATPFEALVNGHPFGSEGFIQTGTAPVFEVRTRRGYHFTATANHRVRCATRRTRYTLKEEWKEVGLLAPGDEILLHDHDSVEWQGRGTECEGWLLGSLVGDGHLTRGSAHLHFWGGDRLEARDLARTVLKETLAFRDVNRPRARLRAPSAGVKSVALKRMAATYDIEHGRKTVTEDVECSSSAFCRGFLRGWFDSDGSVQGSPHQGASVRLTGVDWLALEAAQRMLARLGILSTLYANRKPAGVRYLPDGKQGYRQYNCQPVHEVVISGSNLARFERRVGFSDSAKRQRLSDLLASYRRRLKAERFVDEVVSIEPRGEMDVFDCRVPGVNEFDGNGFRLHNCGEQPLAPNEACNLGSLNLGRFLRDGDVDWERLEQAVATAVRLLDDVIEANPYPLPEIDAMVKANRRIGLGVMGWADLLIGLNIPYDSAEARALAEKVMGFISRAGHDASAALAEERGAFPNWPRSIYRGERPLRNATVTTIAPTGTISIIADCSSGIEPLFALAFRHVVGDRQLDFVHPALERVAVERGLDLPAIVERGSLAGVEGVPDEVRRVLATAHEVSLAGHVGMQAAFQRHTDNGVSKTINLPRDAAVEDVARAYRLAWDEGCLGITVFREGSKDAQVLYAGKPGAARVPPRPRRVEGATYRVESPVGTCFVTVNDDAAGEPFEVFSNVGKAGSDIAAVSEAMGRLISLILRLPSPFTARERVEEIVSQLQGIGGARQIGFGRSRVRSLPDAVAQALAEHVGMAEPSPAVASAAALNPGDLCPECGQATLVFEEGCQKCHSCGYSMC